MKENNPLIEFLLLVICAAVFYCLMVAGIVIIEGGSF